MSLTQPLRYPPPVPIAPHRHSQGFYQRCHDPECSEFRGDMRPLDPGLRDEARAARQT